MMRMMGTMMHEDDGQADGDRTMGGGGVGRWIMMAGDDGEEDGEGEPPPPLHVRPHKGY